jgi:non-homologous end joining protein Ku
MRGDNHLLALTTTVDEISGDVKPLFAFPVQVCKATDDGGDVKFENAAPSGAEIELRRIDTATGEVFEYEDRLRGVQVGDEFRPINAEAIDAIDDATKIKTMVALGQIDLDAAMERYAGRVCGKYFLQSPAKGGSAKAYRLTYEALREKKQGRKIVQPAKAIVTKRTARSRQQLALIYADEADQCLVMLRIAFAAQVREPDAQVLAPQTAEVDEAQIDKARQVIASLGDGSPVLDAEVDEAIALRAELVQKAIDGEAIVAPKKVAETVENDDLMDALEASLAVA